MIWFLTDQTETFLKKHYKRPTDLNHFYNTKEHNITFDMCTPRLLCIPEHCMHIKMPRLTLAHLGPLKIKFFIENCEKTIRKKK